MNYWLVSDTHFNHARMRESRGRFGDWQGKLWRGLYTIPESDILIHLGDICIGNEDSINSRITVTPAKKKILVRGNHPQPPMKHFTLNIHGHTHGNKHRLDEYTAFYKRGYHLDISLELVGFDLQRMGTLMESATGHEAVSRRPNRIVRSRLPLAIVMKEQVGARRLLSPVSS